LTGQRDEPATTPRASQLANSRYVGIHGATPAIMPPTGAATRFGFVPMYSRLTTAGEAEASADN
jgi:hypothetical protein